MTQRSFIKGYKPRRKIYEVFGFIDSVEWLYSFANQEIGYRQGRNLEDYAQQLIFWEHYGQHGVTGEINCTDTFKNALRGKYELTSRGAIDVKGKGMLQAWIIS